MPNWYPIAGSQRLRAAVDLPEIHDQTVRVCRFDKEYWLLFYLWGQKQERDRMVAIWFQMAELVWKSQHYDYDTDPSGTKMTEFEKIGDTLPWKHKK